MNIEEAIDIVIEAAREEAVTQKFNDEFEKHSVIMYAANMLENWSYKNVTSEDN